MSTVEVVRPPPAESLGTHLLANVAGRSWTVLLWILLVPAYVALLGVEAYAVIGLFVVLQGLTSMVDFGLGTTLVRELARSPGPVEDPGRTRDFVRTMEVFYWVAGLLVAVAGFVLSDLIAGRWLRPEVLSESSLATSVALMGVALGLQMPSAMYINGLIGLDRQVLSNALNASGTTVRGVGALLVLVLVAPRIEWFFAWQVFASALQVVVAMAVLWARMPPGRGAPRIRPRLLTGLWPYAAGVSAVGALGLLYTQADRIVLSKLASLEELGYYVIAATVAAGAYFLSTPVSAATFPRLCRSATAGDDRAFAELFHMAAQLVSVLVMPVVLTAAVFAPELLQLWTGNPVVGHRAAPLLVFLLFGYLALALNAIPRNAQLAAGWMRLPLFQSLAGLALFLPILYYAASVQGALGAAVAWAISSAAYTLAGVQLMHGRILVHERVRWLSADVGIPLAASFATAMILHRWLPSDLSRTGLLLFMVGTGAATLAATCIAVPVTRAAGRRWLRQATAKLSRPGLRGPPSPPIRQAVPSGLPNSRRPLRWVWGIGWAVADSIMAAAVLTCLAAFWTVRGVMARMSRRQKPAAWGAHRQLYLDCAYSYRTIRARNLEAFVTSRDLEGFFEHVWTVHPCVGASPEDSPETGVGPVEVFSVAPGHTMVEGKAGRFRSLRRLPRLNFALSQAGLLRLVYGLVRSQRIDVVRAQDPYLPGLLGLTLARATRVPLVVCVVGNYDLICRTVGRPAYPRLFRWRSLEKRVERFVMSRADLVAGGNQDNLNYALANGARKGRSTLFRIGAAIQPTHFADAAGRPDVLGGLGLDSRRCIIFVGRLEPEKYPDDVVECLARVGHRILGAHLVFVGEGRRRAHLEVLARRLGVGDQVSFAGPRDQEWLAGALSHAGVVVLPLAGRALVESMLNAAPVVAYDVEWHRELVEDGVTGVLVPFRDIDRLADAVCRVLADSAEAKELGRRGRLAAMRMMEPRRLVAHEQGMYQALLSGELGAPEHATSIGARPREIA